jgi:S-(hydroxymethyl)glutathione dehydrogenase/alcohol dehydrogenase
MDGKICIGDLITHLAPLQRIDEGLELMMRREPIRSVVIC